MTTPAPSANRSFHVLAKPTGAICNLDCKYCFFLSKQALYPDSDFRMHDDVLELYVSQLLESQPQRVSLAWQGGEPTLMGLPFFERLIQLVAKYRRPGQVIEHTIQTNGTRLDEAWCAFFHQHGFLVGLSIDGPRELHDRYRVDKGGAGTFDHVIRGWELLQQHAVETNVLCTVHAGNADHPLEIYRFFRDQLHARFMQFIPIVERGDANLVRLADIGWGERAVTPAGQSARPLYTQSGDLVTSRSLQPAQLGRFLIGIFDEWVRHDVGRVYVQIFDVTLGAHLGQYTLCVHSPTCGDAVALEHNGDLYSCDHFVEPAYLLGNIRDQTMAAMVGSPAQLSFGAAKRDALPQYCRQCSVLYACNGGCPKDRFATTPDGEPGLNYLCAGYKRFFEHVQQPMQIMASLLDQQRPPAEIMHWYQAQDATWRAQARLLGRNDPCPCGSGRKAKHCHGS